MKIRLLLLLLILIPVHAKAQVSDSMYYHTSKYHPIFDEGKQSLTDFLTKNINYSKATQNGKVTGKVFVEFIIEKDGSISNIKPLSAKNSLTEEVARILKLSPKWTPGMDEYKPNEKTVSRVMFTLPVNFTATDINVPVLKTAQDSIDNRQVFVSDDINPSFKGGDQAFNRYLSKNIHYPKTARESNIKGRVFISFVVEEDGTLSNFCIVRDPGSGLGEESLRVLKLSPKWTAGIKNKQPVRVQYTVPINFSLAK